MPRTHREPLVLLGLTAAVVVLSGIGARDPFTWLLEVMPILIAAPLLVATYRRFRFTPLVYRLLFVHACILALGGHYTYAHVPLGDWAQEAFGLARNHYDRIGHLAQGFIPALVVREVLVRQTPLRPGKWLFFLVTSVALAVSASYELIEWWTAVLRKEGADAFLGTQGDVWDTQWDMFLCLIGALTSQITLAGRQDREMGTNPNVRGA